MEGYSQSSEWQTTGTSYAVKMWYAKTKKSQGKRDENRHKKNDNITGNKTKLVDQGRREEVNDNRVRNSMKSREKL